MGKSKWALSCSRHELLGMDSEAAIWIKTQRRINRITPAQKLMNPKGKDWKIRGRVTEFVTGHQN